MGSIIIITTTIIHLIYIPIVGCGTRNLRGNVTFSEPSLTVINAGDASIASTVFADMSMVVSFSLRTLGSTVKSSNLLMTAKLPSGITFDIGVGEGSLGNSKFSSHDPASMPTC